MPLFARSRLRPPRSSRAGDCPIMSGRNGPRAMTLGKSISILWRDRSTDEFYQPHLQGCRFLSGGVDVGDSRKLDRHFESSARNMTRSQAGGVNEPCPVSDWNSLFAVEGHACIHDGFDLFSVGFVASHGAHKYGLGYTAKGSKVVGRNHDVELSVVACFP